MFIHCVYFWLKDDLSTSEVSQFKEGLHDLTTISSVNSGHYGRPASTDRPIIDRSYDYGLVVVFMDEVAHDAYQDHPVHDRFRESCSDFWEEVKIYDLDTSEEGMSSAHTQV